MQEQIQKLRNEREKLTTEFQNSRTEYKTEVKRIDRAIKSFERGINELNGGIRKPARYKSPSVIEEILTEKSQLHLKQLCEILNERGIPIAYQSLSGLMQTYAKAGKKFVKTAPATYGLIGSENNTQEEISSKTGNEMEAAEEPANSVELKIAYDIDTNSLVSGEDNE